jgi:hypothetical protein
MDLDSPAGCLFPGPSYAQGQEDDVQHINLWVMFPPTSRSGNTQAQCSPSFREGKKKIALAQLCKDFRLPHSGNKSHLLNRLRTFSTDKEQWKM